MEKFIKKHRTKPLLLDGLEAAIRRLPYEDSSLIEKYHAVQAGFGGEQQLDRVFEREKYGFRGARRRPQFSKR